MSFHRQAVAGEQQDHQQQTHGQAHRQTEHIDQRKLTVPPEVTQGDFEVATQH